MRTPCSSCTGDACGKPYPFSVPCCGADVPEVPIRSSELRFRGGLHKLDQYFPAAGSRHEEKIDARAVRTSPRCRINRLERKSLAKNLRRTVHIIHFDFDLLYPLAKF